jgi:hypothetical protein
MASVDDVVGALKAATDAQYAAALKVIPVANEKSIAQSMPKQ